MLREYTQARTEHGFYFILNICFGDTHKVELGGQRLEGAHVSYSFCI